MNSKSLTVTVGVGAIVLLIAALTLSSRHKTPQLEPDGEAQQVSATEILTSIPSPNRRYKIGVLFPFLAAPFWINEHYGVIDQAQLVGVDIVWLSADGYTNVSRQNDQIQDLLVQGIDGLIVAPTSFQGNAPAIARVIERGIPVVVHVTDTAAEGVATRILADDYIIGKQQAEYLLDHHPTGSLRIAMISGPSGADWADNRASGFRDALAETERVTIVAERFGEPERSAAQTIADDLLVTFSDLNAIYVAADGMAIGVATSVERAGRSDEITITTASFSRESLEYIRNGLIDLNVDENPILQGRAAINAMVHALNGSTVPKKIVVPSPGHTLETLEAVNIETQWAPPNYRPD